jgi:hypothetical protein
MKIQVKASRCELGGRHIYPTNVTFTHFPRRVSKCRFGGKNKSPTNFTSTCFPRGVCRCEVGRRIINPAKPTSTYFASQFEKSERCKFGDKRYGNNFFR